ncbi:MAG: gamma carbonic anhydrase family protein [Eubacteriales bacterium]
MIEKIGDRVPKIGKDCFIANTAMILGDVEISDNVAIWFGAVIRGDLAKIIIGRGTNIQDNSVVHVSKDVPTTIGNNVTIAHGSVIHACTVGDNCLIGIKSVILDHAEIGENSIIGAMSFVGNGKKIPSGVMAVGVPAKVIRELTQMEIESLKGYAERNYKNAKDNYLNIK